MSYVFIDRRLNPSGKHHGNRQRFLKRVKASIKESIKDAINNNKIKSIGTEGKVVIPAKDISEPYIDHDEKTGTRKRVLAGNKDFLEGDKIARPPSGSDGGNQGSSDGDGDDDFVFVLSREEFLNHFFDDLELPDLNKKDLLKTYEQIHKHMGYTNNGNPANLDVRKSYAASISRRIALNRPKSDKLKELQEELTKLKEKNIKKDAERIKFLEIEIDKIIKKRKVIPYFDEMDLRYKFFKKIPNPTTNAVMFCLLDVSASMDETKKEWAKKFFILLYLFLQRHYKTVDIVFIRHHDTAQEVNETDFFSKVDTGGTVVSSAIQLMKDIIKERYNKNSWNIYVGQASDGDNYPNDNPIVTQLLDEMLPYMQYYAYVQISSQMSEMNKFFAQQANLNNLWSVYNTLSTKHKNLQIRHITNNTEIWPVFRELFNKKASNVKY